MMSPAALTVRPVNESVVTDEPLAFVAGFESNRTDIALQRADVYHHRPVL